MGNIFTRAGLVGSTAEDLARKRELGERLQSRALASLETSRANRKEAERIARLIDERIRSQKQGAALQQAQEVARKTQNVGSIEDGALTNYDTARKTQKAPRQTPAGIRPRTVTRAQRDALSYDQAAPARTTPIGPLVRGGSPLPPYAATSMMGSQLGAVPDDLNRLNDQIRLASARADGMFRVPASSLGPRRMESTGSIEDAALAGMLGATPGAQPASAGLGESFLNVLVPAAQGSTSTLEALESSGWPDIVRLTPTVLDISEINSPTNL
jgi:hypothetical protein